jgi:hypothetical protein
MGESFYRDVIGTIGFIANAIQPDISSQFPLWAGRGTGHQLRGSAILLCGNWRDDFAVGFDPLT